MAEEGLLDELGAARSLVRVKAGRYGKRRLARELAARGFDDETAAAALADLDAEREETVLAKLFERLWRQSRGLEPARRRARVARALERRGFSSARISAMIRRFEKTRKSDEID